MWAVCQKPSIHEKQFSNGNFMVVWIACQDTLLAGNPLLQIVYRHTATCPFLSGICKAVPSPFYEPKRRIPYENQQKKHEAMVQRPKLPKKIPKHQPRPLYFPCFPHANAFFRNQHPLYEPPDQRTGPQQLNPDFKGIFLEIRVLHRYRLPGLFRQGSYQKPCPIPQG